MDRYPQNSISGIHDGSKILRYYDNTKSFIINLFLKKEDSLLRTIKNYQYDLIIRILVSHQTSFKMKPEESLESLTKKENSISEIKYDAFEVVDINGKEEYNVVLQKIKELIWERL